MAKAKMLGLPRGPKQIPRDTRWLKKQKGAQNGRKQKTDPGR